MTTTARTVRPFLLLCALFGTPPPLAALDGRPAHSLPAPAPRDGQRDFDFEIGSWKTSLARLDKPLTGSTTWIHYEGTSVVRPLMDGRANLVELDVRGPSGRIQGVSLRLYDPRSRQWSLNFAGTSGVLSPPTIGRFRDGRGEFYAQETFGGRAVLVRFVISEIGKDSCRFEQAFSEDGGRTWEVNWIATDTRVADARSGPAPGDSRRGALP